MNSERRRVVAVDARLLAYRRGGIPRYVEQLATHLPAAAPDLDFRLVVNRHQGTPDAATMCVRTPPHHRLERWSLGFELSLRRPALVHSPDFVPPLTVGTPRVVTVHDLAFVDRPGELTPDAARYYGQLPRAIKGVDHVIAVSESTRARVVELFRIPPDRVTTVYNGVDDRFYAPASEPPHVVLSRELGARTAQMILAERPVILVVGTVEPRKRHALLTEAIAILASARRESPPLLVVVGQPGWQSTQTEAAIAALVERGHAIRLATVTDDALRALYRTATLLALPSRDEGFGLPAAEAMASGLPVIASDRGALPEVVGDAGLLLAEDDPGAWASAIAALLDDACRRAAFATGGAARARRFRWETTAQRTATIYREVLGT